MQPYKKHLGFKIVMVKEPIRVTEFKSYTNINITIYVWKYYRNVQVKEYWSHCKTILFCTMDNFWFLSGIFLTTWENHINRLQNEIHIDSQDRFGQQDSIWFNKRWHSQSLFQPYGEEKRKHGSWDNKMFTLFLYDRCVFGQMYDRRLLRYVCDGCVLEQMCDTCIVG